MKSLWARVSFWYPLQKAWYSPTVCGSSGLQSAKSTLRLPLVREMYASMTTPSVRTDDTTSTLSGTQRNVASLLVAAVLICRIRSAMMTLVFPVCWRRMMSVLKDPPPCSETTSNSEVPWNMVRLIGRMPPFSSPGTTS